jgi:hypothetical protein
MSVLFAILSICTDKGGVMTDCTMCPARILAGEVVQHIDGNPVCEDCYFGEMGRLVEQQPIFNPTRIQQRILPFDFVDRKRH